ncbi:MAG: prolipoprotein diacylglyceryl transferase [Marmoricola sp.]
MSVIAPHLVAQLVADFIPSPGQGVWHLGPVPIRAYALCIIGGVIAAVWFGERRWAARGGTKGEVGDIAIWGVPFGLVGARLYHVVTDHDLYFGHGKGWHGFLQAFEIWHGGLGIWGAIAAGVLGGAIAAKRRGIKMLPLLDALAPTLLLAQAIGRWGNYFNQELFGRPTKLPWGLEIDKAHRPTGYDQYATFHPTFLYESLWNLGGLGLVLWADRRFNLGRGRVFALYVMVYTAGRAWIEGLRIDNIELNNVFGLRWGVWMSIGLFVLALGYFVWATKNRPGREESPYVEGREPDLEQTEESVGDGADQPAADSGIVKADADVPGKTERPD